jgi:lipopolysaccharide/colanic/teichoic acid biosynthesis glycosyltransferase
MIVKSIPPPAGSVRAASAIARGVARPAGYHRWRGMLDRPLALLLLIPGLPLIGLLALLVRITSPGPAIHRQTRVGRGGKLFVMYKIRTMRRDAEQCCGPIWARCDDSRVTRLGRALRRSHLDELPQLFNVLKGEMALVGPRPERPEFTPLLARAIPAYADRLQVLPGVTGLAQINLPPDAALDDVRRKLILDLEYLRVAGPWFDARVLLCTPPRLLGLRGEPLLRLLRLRRSAVRLDASLRGGRR